MSSHDLTGATGAMLGVAEIAHDDTPPNVQIHKNHQGFIVRGLVFVPEEQLRDWCDGQAAMVVW